MARFDVHQVRGGLALDYQADGLAYMPTRFVIPVEPYNKALLINDRLNPRVEIGGRTMLLVTQLAGTIRARDLGDVVISLTRDSQQLAVQGALDLLTTGV